MLNIIKVYPSKRLFGFIFTIKVDWWYGLQPTHVCFYYVLRAFLFTIFKNDFLKHAMNKR